MKNRIGFLGLLFLFLAPAAFSQYTTTANLELKKPDHGSVANWDVYINSDLDQLDALLSGFSTFPANSTTPSVANSTRWVINNPTAITITNFAGAYSGQQIILICQDTTTIVNVSPTINVVSSFSCSTGLTLTLVYINSVWVEVARVQTIGSSEVAVILAGNNAYTGNNSFAGTTNFTGAVSGANINSVLYVGGPLGSFWGTSDIMGQINAAKAVAPSQGATIYVLPQVGGGCYQTNGSTTVSFNTVGQYFQIIGTAPISDSSGQVIGGSCIQDTKTTAHNLITLDWTPAAGGAYVPGGGIQNLAFVNSSTDGGTTQCTTVGGCSSSANAVVIGGTNGGVHKGYFSNVMTSGFSSGFLLQDASGIGWGITWNNVSFSHDTIGLNDTVGHENESCFGCIFGANGTAAFMNTGELSLFGGSTDSNVTAGISLGNGAVLKTSGMHWENLGTGNNGTDITFVTGGAGTGFHSVNDEIVDDTSTGTTSQSFFTFGIGSINGLQFGSNSGRTYSGKAFNCLSSCSVQAYMFDTGAFQTANSICPAAACSGSVNIQSNFSFSSAFSLTLSQSAQPIGKATTGSVFYVRDHTLGGIAIVTVDTNGSPPNVAVSGVVGAVVMVAGTPSAAQIGFSYSGGFLQITGGSSTSADTINYTQTLLQ